MAAGGAPDGKVLAVAESLAVQRGRGPTRRTLEAVLQAEADAACKKGLRSASAAGNNAVTREPPPAAS